MEPCLNSVSPQTVGLPMAGKLIGMGRWRKEGGERERKEGGDREGERSFKWVSTTWGNIIKYACYNLQASTKQDR